MAHKYALIIGNNEYQDHKLAKLTAPKKDVEDLVSLLQDPKIGAFDEVKKVENVNTSTAQRAIASFFSKKKKEDLLLLYFSGHSILNERGKLYLAFPDTEYELLSATAIPTHFLTQEMNQCRSMRQILMLDCCHSGAFSKGTKSAIGTRVGIPQAFEGNGYGRVVLTASDSTQYAWEGNQFIGEAQNSLFTHYLIEGIKSGKADRDNDGLIGLNELYEYVHEQVIKETPNQTPGKWSYQEDGNLIIAKNPKPLSMEKLPPELAQAMANPLAAVRQAIVGELEKLLYKEDDKMKRAAYDALESLAHDESETVAESAAAVMKVYAEKQQEAEEEKKREAVQAILVQGQSKLDQGLYQEAKEIFETGLQIIAEHPDLTAAIQQCDAGLAEIEQVQNYLKEGIEKFEAGEYEAASANFEEVLKSEPEHAQALEYKMKIQRKTLRMELVQQLIEEAESNLSRKKFGQAATTFRRVLEMDPENEIAQSGLKNAQVGLVPGKQSTKTAQGTRSSQKIQLGMRWLAGAAAVVLLAAAAWFFMPSSADDASADAVINLSGPASQARTEMLNQKKRAEEADSKNKAPDTFQKALNEEEKGNQLAKEGKHWDAKQSYDMAREYFIMAIEGAEFSALSPEEAEKRVLENRLKREVIDLKRAMVRVQSQAKDEKADRLAKKLFSEALGYSQTGDQQYKDKDYAAASSSFEKATSSFKNSIKLAKEKSLEAEKDLNNVRKIVLTAKEEMQVQKERATDAGGKEKAGEFFAEAEKKEQAAETEFRKGNKQAYLSAQTLFSEAKESFIDVVTEIERLGRLKADKQDAEEAKSSMLAARNSIIGDDTELEQLVNHKKAQSKERTAENLLEAGIYKDASRGFKDAEKLYADAKEELEELRRKLEEDRLKNVDKKSADMALNALKNKESEEALAQNRIEGMIIRFKEGFEREDFGLLQPFVAPGADKAWTPLFEDAENIRITISNQRIQVKGEEADASFDMMMEFFSKGRGKTQKQNLPTKNWKLKKANGDWVIVSGK